MAGIVGRAARCSLDDEPALGVAEIARAARCDSGRFRVLSTPTQGAGETDDEGAASRERTGQTGA